MQEANQPTCHSSDSACRYLNFLHRIPGTCAHLNTSLVEKSAEAILLRLPCTARSVSITRRLVHEALVSWQVSPSVAERMILVVSELVTNAVQHSTLSEPALLSDVRTYFELAVFLLRDHIRVEVLDRSQRLPVHLTAHDYAETGRGMGIVQYCTRRWGADRLCAGGKVVWCDVDMDEPPCALDEAVERPEHGRPAAGRPGIPSP
ncbi:ATP-binding protein [Streptomyces sp. NPDC046197]|uniref:ATP-binding protein n=1 Tax=Streptomyces sp. NPDC046197 TaxID=3154337 RepID=UPI0033F97922